MTMTLNNITFPSNGDDYIGTESCIDLQSDNFNDVVHHFGTSKSNSATAPSVKQAKHKRSTGRRKEKREFPPPIPLLARTQNLPSHMPWVLKRYYTSDGRLILKEEKLMRHEYFQAHRVNGRLTLQLVPLDDDVLDGLPRIPQHDQDDEFLGASEEVEAATSNPHEEINDRHSGDDRSSVTNRFTDEQDKTSIVFVADGLPLENDKGVAGGTKCLNSRNTVRSSKKCIFGVPVHPVRTVRG